MRPFNFSPGPSALPEEVLKEVQVDLLDHASTGLSIMEMSHRSPEYTAVHEGARQRIRDLFELPKDFEVILLQGGATLQFSMVPLNLLGAGRRGGYVRTGSWGAKAFADAVAIADAYVAWDGEPGGLTGLPDPGDIRVEQGTRYVHLTSNETIGGVQFSSFPRIAVPLVADMSSDIASKPIDFEAFDLIYAGAQKNLGPAGVTVVLVRQAVLDEDTSQLGAYLRYGTHASKQSLYNTPPTLAIYVLGKVLRWIEERGGLAAMEKASIEKSDLVYEQIDSSDGFYANPVEKSARSRMNVVFTLPDPDRESAFLAAAADRRMLNVKGHRSVGGIRVSLYNAVPLAAAEAMAELMQEFRATA